jgi:hypothetical protein
MVRRGRRFESVRGLAKSPLTGVSVQNDLLFVACAVGMEPFMELFAFRGAGGPEEQHVRSGHVCRQHVQTSVTTTPQQLARIAGFIWGIADDVLRDLDVRGKYRDVILPMTVLRSTAPSRRHTTAHLAGHTP